MNNKGVELPITLIGIIVLFLVIFVVLVTAFSGSFSNYWGKFMSVFGVSASSSSLQAWQMKCQQLCSLMDSMIRTECEAGNYDYCLYVKDSSEFGGLKEDHCFSEQDDALRYTCQIKLKGGATATIDSNSCSDTCSAT